MSKQMHKCYRFTLDAYVPSCLFADQESASVIAATDFPAVRLREYGPHMGMSREDSGHWTPILSMICKLLACLAWEESNSIKEQCNVRERTSFFFLADHVFLACSYSRLSNLEFFSTSNASRGCPSPVSHAPIKSALSVPTQLFYFRKRKREGLIGKHLQLLHR